MLPLVEVIRTAHTSDEVFDAAYAFVGADRQGAGRLQRHPGFIVNRILIPLLNDCVRVLDEVARRAGRRRSRDALRRELADRPCALIDLIGVDVHVHASEALHAALGEERMAPPRAASADARAGQLGRKTGQGFYDYQQP